MREMVEIEEDAVAMKAPRVPVWDYHAILARLEILVSFPIRSDGVGTGAFQIAPNCVVGFHFRPLTNSDVHSQSCPDIELARVAHGTMCRFVVWSALGAAQALTPPKFVRMTVKFH